MLYSFPQAVLQIFCKAPVPGQVKTRLMPNLNAFEAAEVHKKLTERALDLACSSPLCQVQLWCAPTTEHPFFCQVAQKYPLTLKSQCAGDLGERMHHALSEGLEQFEQAILIGCDCPSLTVADLHTALTALRESNTCVLAPTEDGGYSLIGLNQPHSELFTEMRWSCAEVFDETRKRMQRLGLNCFTLPKQWDVDCYCDYLRFTEFSAHSST